MVKNFGNVMERILKLFFLDLDFRIAKGDVKTYAIIFIRLHLLKKYHGEDSTLRNYEAGSSDTYNSVKLGMDANQSGIGPLRLLFCKSLFCTTKHELVKQACLNNIVVVNFAKQYLTLSQSQKL